VHDKKTLKVQQRQQQRHHQLLRLNNN
jgi:hypothetical protein